MITQPCSPHVCFNLLGDGQDFLPCFPGEFNHKDGTRISLHKEPVFALLNIPFGALQDIMINQFTRTGPVFEANQVGMQRLINAVEMHTEQACFFGRRRHYIELDFCDESQRSFRTRNQ